MKTTTKKINFVNKRGKITGSVIVKETICKPIMNDLSFDPLDFYFPKVPLTMIVVDRRKKRKCRKM